MNTEVSCTKSKDRSGYGRRKILRQRHRHAADAADDVEDAIVRSQVAELTEIFEEVSAHLLEVAAAHGVERLGRNERPGARGVDCDEDWIHARGHSPAEPLRENAAK